MSNPPCSWGNKLIVPIEFIISRVLEIKLHRVIDTDNLGLVRDFAIQCTIRRFSIARIIEKD